MPPLPARSTRLRWSPERRCPVQVEGEEAFEDGGVGEVGGPGVGGEDGGVEVGVGVGEPGGAGVVEVGEGAPGEIGGVEAGRVEPAVAQLDEAPGGLPYSFALFGVGAGNGKVSSGTARGLAGGTIDAGITLEPLPCPSAPAPASLLAHSRGAGRIAACRG
jgi:hypothetical protein